MAEPQQDEQTDVIHKASETIVLGIELVDAELNNLPERLVKGVQSKDVQDAINKALNEFAMTRLNRTPTTVSTDDAQALAKMVAEAGGKALEQNVIEQIKKSSHYKALDQSIKDLTEDLKNAPMGVWLNENKTWLYIVGAGAVLGGATAMYVTRTGDALTSRLLPQLSGQSVSFKPIGTMKMEVGISQITFTPSQRHIEAKTFMKVEWQQIKAQVNLSASRSDKSVTAAADGSILVPIKPGVDLTAGGGYNSGKKDWSLSLGVKVDVVKGLQLGVFAGVGKGGLGTLPGGDAFKAMPTPPKDENKTHGFVGLGISGSF